MKRFEVIGGAVFALLIAAILATFVHDAYLIFNPARSFVKDAWGISVHDEIGGTLCAMSARPENCEDYERDNGVSMFYGAALIIGTFYVLGALLYKLCQSSQPRAVT